MATTLVGCAALLPGAVDAGGPEPANCQVGDPSAGFPDRPGPARVLSRQVVETSDALILTCRGPLVAFVDGQTVEIGNPSGRAAFFTGFECTLHNGWLQQGHPGPDYVTTDSRQVTSADGQTTLRCVFHKPLVLSG